MNHFDDRYLSSTGFLSYLKCLRKFARISVIASSTYTQCRLYIPRMVDFQQLSYYCAALWRVAVIRSYSQQVRSHSNQLRLRPKSIFFTQHILPFEHPAFISSTKRSSLSCRRECHAGFHTWPQVYHLEQPCEGRLTVHPDESGRLMFEEL